MSFDAIRWAFEQAPGKSTEKFVLIAMANRANASGELWSSVAQICEDTLLNRKTVLAALKDLCSQKLIADTGERKGSTGQIKVYKLILDESVKNPKNGTLKQSQKRNSTENGTVPKTDTNSTENGTLKQSQKRDTEPVRSLTSKEPVNNYCQERIPDAEIALENLNAICLKKFRPTKTNLKNISARLKEKFTLDELALVAEHKSFTWSKDPRMREYLRPQTLYSEKFEAYLQASIEWHQAGRPDYENHKPAHRETSFERSQRIAREFETRLLREIAELESEEAGSDHYASLAANG